MLRHMPATPMTQQEMEAQCRFVAAATDGDPGEEHELTPKRFEVGRRYSTPSICDSECIFTIKIHRRTAKSVWITGLDIKTPSRRKIEIWEGVESIYPFGKYSMAAIIRADG